MYSRQEFTSPTPDTDHDISTTRNFSESHHWVPLATTQQTSFSPEPLLNDQIGSSSYQTPHQTQMSVSSPGTPLLASPLREPIGSSSYQFPHGIQSSTDSMMNAARVITARQPAYTAHLYRQPQIPYRTHDRTQSPNNPMMNPLTAPPCHQRIQSLRPYQTPYSTQSPAYLVANPLALSPYNQQIVSLSSNQVPYEMQSSVSSTMNASTNGQQIEPLRWYQIPYGTQSLDNSMIISAEVSASSEQVGSSPSDQVSYSTQSSADSLLSPQTASYSTQQVGSSLPEHASYSTQSSISSVASAPEVHSSEEQADASAPGDIPDLSQYLVDWTSSSPAVSPSKLQETTLPKKQNDSASRPEKPRKDCILCTRLKIECVPLLISSTKSQCEQCYTLNAECYTISSRDSPSIEREAALDKLEAFYKERKRLLRQPIRAKAPPRRLSPPSPAKFLWNRGPPTFPIQDFTAGLPDAQNTPAYPSSSYTPPGPKRAIRHSVFSSPVDLMSSDTSVHGTSSPKVMANGRADPLSEVEDLNGSTTGLFSPFSDGSGHMIPWIRRCATETRDSLLSSCSLFGMEPAIASSLSEERLERHDLSMKDIEHDILEYKSEGAGGVKRWMDEFDDPEDVDKIDWWVNSITWTSLGPTSTNVFLGGSARRNSHDSAGVESMDNKSR